MRKRMEHSWVWTGQRAASQSCDSCARPKVSEEKQGIYSRPQADDVLSVYF